MRATILTDNYTFIDKYYTGEPGFCLYIENENDHILLDTGYSDVFIQNAKKMNIDLSTINKIVISHGHNDHTRGLTYFAQEFGLEHVEIIAHPLAFEEKNYHDFEIGSPLSLEQLKSASKSVILTANPLEISPNLFFLGEIDAVEEPRYALGTTNGNPDYLLDDTAIVYRGTDSITIMTGCSHSGICNIIEAAIKLTGIDNIARVIGGFHLMKTDERLTRTVKYLKARQIQSLCPCHCVNLASKIAIAQEMPIVEGGVSYTFETD